jgi:hypothetical protein
MPADNVWESSMKQANRTFRLANILLFLSVAGNIAVYIYGVWQSPSLSVRISLEVLVRVLWIVALVLLRKTLSSDKSRRIVIALLVSVVLSPLIPLLPLILFSLLSFPMTENIMSVTVVASRTVGSILALLWLPLLGCILISEVDLSNTIGKLIFWIGIAANIFVLVCSVLFETLFFHPLSTWGSFSVEVLVLVLWSFATRDRWQS